MVFEKVLGVIEERKGLSVHMGEMFDDIDKELIRRIIEEKLLATMKWRITDYYSKTIRGEFKEKGLLFEYTNAIAKAKYISHGLEFSILGVKFSLFHDVRYHHTERINLYFGGKQDINKVILALKELGIKVRTNEATKSFNDREAGLKRLSILRDAFKSL